jgi:hypothetical protein
MRKSAECVQPSSASERVSPRGTEHAHGTHMCVYLTPLTHAHAPPDRNAESAETRRTNEILNRQPSSCDAILPSAT